MTHFDDDLLFIFFNLSQQSEISFRNVEKVCDRPRAKYLLFPFKITV